MFYFPLLPLRNQLWNQTVMEPKGTWIEDHFSSTPRRKTVLKQIGLPLFHFQYHFQYHFHWIKEKKSKYEDVVPPGCYRAPAWLRIHCNCRVTGLYLLMLDWFPVTGLLFFISVLWLQERLRAFHFPPPQAIDNLMDNTDIGYPRDDKNIDVWHLHWLQEFHILSWYKQDKFHKKDFMLRISCVPEKDCA